MSFWLPLSVPTVVMEMAKEKEGASEVFEDR